MLPIDALFASFRAATSDHRRLLDRLIVEGEPHLKRLVDDLRRSHREVPFDDAMQAARIGLLRALEQYRPGKGTFHGYLRLKVRHEVQRVAFYGRDVAEPAGLQPFPAD